MEKLLSNFYIEWSLFIIFITFVAIASIDILKNKHNIDIKNKLNYKNIDFKFLLKMIFLSLGLRIILEYYLIPTNENDVFIPIGAIQLIVQFIATCIFAPICEEIIFRFGIYEYLNKNGISSIFSIIITSITFAIIHFYGINATIILVIISYIWNYTYYKTNNLLYPILLHFIHNLYAIMSNFITSNNFYINFSVLSIVIFIILSIKRQKH